MFDLLKPLARPNLFTFNELSHGVERSGGEMASLRLVGKFLSGKLTDEVGEGLRDFRSVRVTVFRIFPFGTRKRLIGHPVLRELSPHVRHIGGEMDVASVFAAVDGGTGTAIVPAAGPPLQPILSRVARHRTAVGEGQSLLERNIDAFIVSMGSRASERSQRNSH